MPLTFDDLPGDRCGNAIGLWHFLRHHPRPPLWFSAGSPSAAVVLDLELIGLVTLLPSVYCGLPVLKILHLKGEGRA